MAMKRKPYSVSLRKQNKRHNTQCNFGRIGVLMGGSSSEREISLKSGKAVYDSLKELNLDVVALDIKTEDVKENIRLIRAQKIDCAFLTLHGRFGEDGQIQEILDNLKIPYTGSGRLASRLAMDKAASRKILQVYGVPVPRYKVVDKISYNTFWKVNDGFVFPVVVKPARQGSSIGLSIVDKIEELDKAVDFAFAFDQNVLIEEYINGREVTVGILAGEALPVIEIIPKKRFFDYEAKYSQGLTDYMVPAQLDKEIAQRIRSTALSVHNLLGCFAYSRVDMILSRENIPFVLEVNTTPGFTQTSLFPKAAKVRGLDFKQLCLQLIRLAYGKA